MATQTEPFVPHLTVDAVDEKIEKLVDEEKAMEEESVTPCKDIGEEDSIKVAESQTVTSILAKSEEEEVDPKLDSPAIKIKSDDQIEPIPESQIPEDIKAVVKEVIDPRPKECVEQLMKDGSEVVDVAAPAVEIEREEKTSTDLPAKIESEKPVIAEVRDILEPADKSETSIEPPACTVKSSQEQDDQPIADPVVNAGGLLADTSAEKEQDDEPSVESVIEKQEEQPGVTSVEREQDYTPSMEAVTREEEEEEEHLTIDASEKELDEQQPESVLKEVEEKPSLISFEKEQEEQSSINTVIKEAEDQLADGSVEKNPEDQPLAEPKEKEVEDQLEVEQKDQPSLPSNSIPPLQVECGPTMETEQPMSVLPRQKLEPAIVKETTYSDSLAVNTESEPSTTMDTEQPVPVLRGEELEPAIVKETTHSDSGTAKVESEPATTIEMEQPVPVLPREELEPAMVKETTHPDSGDTNVEFEPTTAMEVEQPVVVLPGEELETAIVKETTDSDSGATNNENPQQEAAGLDDKQTEQLQNTDEVCEPQGDAAADTVKDERISAVDAENTTLVKEEVCKEVKEIVNSEEERVEQSKSAGGEDSIPPILESIKEVNEPSAVETAEKLSRDVVLTDEKSEVEDGETTVKMGEGNKETEEEIAQLTSVEDVGSSLFTGAVAKSSTDGERSCQEADLIAENKTEEDVKDENAAVTETTEVEKTVENLTIDTGHTAEENTQRSVELSTEKMADADKPEVEYQEPSTKDGESSKASENQQQEVPSKPAQKHSNNILSKVKQSLVKAKKAIIGKSPGSKNHPSETKGDIQVK